MADLCAFNLQWVRTHEILMFAQLSERGSHVLPEITNLPGKSA